MTFNKISMIQQKVQTDFDDMLVRVLSADEHSGTADQMERDLFQWLLQIGAGLMQLFLDVRSQASSREAIINANGQLLPYHGERKRDYYSIFGKLEFSRPYFYQRHGCGANPLDGELGLGEDSYSDYLRELYEELGAYIPYEKTGNILGRFLGIHLSKRVLQEFISADAADVEAYYEQKPAPPIEEEASILVAQADGKGVPIVKASQNSQKVRLHRGEARSRKKAVVVTALYTIQSAPRKAEDILRTLHKEEQSGLDGETVERYRPQHKELHGTLQGKEVALAGLAEQRRKRDGPHIQHRVALCDGEKALQKRLMEHLPGFTLVLDFIHAYEYLWKAVTCLFGQDNPERLPWVREQTRLLLTHQVEKVIDILRQPTGQLEPARRQQLEKFANYFEKNLAYMDYAVCLEQGWPIASGVIEGACRHFVKDRLEMSGMRWTQPGAENLLRIRAVAENGDWDDYHQFRKQQRQQRLYGYDWPAPTAISAGDFHSPPKNAQPSLHRQSTHSHSMTSQSYDKLPLAA